MPNDVITVRLPSRHAAFLQANLSALATATRQAMAGPGLRAERRTALSSRALLLETIEDAVHSALMERPQDARKGTAPMETRNPWQHLNRLSAA
jgi:hypothetical protein